MNLIISNNSEIPIYEQIREKIKKSINTNELKGGEVLPSVRTLAKDLRISILTVKKAYDELENDGYIKTVQGKGSFVISRSKKLIKEEQIKIIENHINEIIKLSKANDISQKEIIDLFKYLYGEEKNGRNIRN